MPQSTTTLTKYFNLSDKVQKICEKFMHNMHLTHFGYIEMYADGSFRELENKKENFSLLLQDNIPEDCSLKILESREEFGFYLSDLYGDNFFPKPLKDIHEKQHEDHFMQILEMDRTAGQPVIRYYTYGADKANQNINQDYINQQTSFMKFNLYFRKQAQQLFETIEPVQISKDSSERFKKLVQIKASEHQKKQAMKVLDTFAMRTAHLKLSKRQNEVLSLYIRNFSARDIGTSLDISHRTVERHIASLYQIFNCHSRLALIQRIKEIEHYITVNP